MISISVGDEWLGGIGGSINKFVVKRAFEISEKMFNCLPVFDPRVCIEACKYTYCIRDIWTS